MICVATMTYPPPRFARERVPVPIIILFLGRWVECWGLGDLVISLSIRGSHPDPAGRVGAGPDRLA